MLALPCSENIAAPQVLPLKEIDNGSSWLDSYTVQVVCVPVEVSKKGYTINDHRLRIRDVISFSLFEKIFFRVDMPPFYRDVVTTVYRNSVEYEQPGAKLTALCNIIFTHIVPVPGKKKYDLYIPRDLCSKLRDLLLISNSEQLDKCTISRVPVNEFKEEVLRNRDSSGAAYFAGLTEGTIAGGEWNILAERWKTS
jgi:hypothetical protein